MSYGRPIKIPNETEIDFMRQAYEVAIKNSKDPSTQNGAILVKDKKIIGVGWTRFARGLEVTEERLSDRVKKLELTTHTEKATIVDAIKKGHSPKGAVMYCPWAACISCAKDILEFEISSLVGHHAKYSEEESNHSRDWYKEIIEAEKMLKEGGVQTHDIDYYFGLKILRGGRIIKV